MRQGKERKRGQEKRMEVDERKKGRRGGMDIHVSHYEVSEADFPTLSRKENCSTTSTTITINTNIDKTPPNPAPPLPPQNE